MKEISTLITNCHIIRSDKSFFPSIELIFVVADPQYTVDQTKKEVTKEYKFETIRMVTNQEGIKMLIADLTKTYEDMDNLSRCAAAAEMVFNVPENNQKKEDTNGKS
jgi:hypothetical protein